MSQLTRTLVCVLSGAIATRAWAGSQLNVQVDETTISTPTVSTRVTPGQAVGGPVFFWEVGNFAPGWTLNGTARFSWQIDQPPGGVFPSAALSFVPAYPQVSAASNGSFLDVTFNALPMTLAHPDPAWTSVLSFGHWSWTVDPAAAGLTLWPEFELGNLTFNYSGPLPPASIPVQSYSMSGFEYFVVPAPASAATFAGALALAARRRRSPAPRPQASVSGRGSSPAGLFRGFARVALEPRATSS